ncbi:MAG: hypothetical protein WBM17_00435 [Anaerolineales bacterium]
MKCEKCGAETEFGNPYYCYYGKMIRSTTSTGPAGYGGWQNQTTISQYQMGGEKSAWFCDRCVTTRYGTEQRNPSLYGCLITGLLTACCPSLLIFNPGENLGALFKIITLFAVLLGLAALFPLIRGIRALHASHGDPNALHALLQDDLAKNGFITDSGDELVLKREKDGLKSQGFDSFFTRRNKPTPIPPPPQ